MAIPPTLIIDLGSGYLKYGFVKQSSPRVLPACYAAPDESAESSSLLSFDSGRQGWVFPLETGTITDCKIVAPLLEQVFDELKMKASQFGKTDLELQVFASSDGQKVDSICEDLEEILKFRNVTASLQQVTTLMDLDRATGLVVDIGYSVSIVAPVFQGFLLQDRVLTSATGAFFISAALSQLLMVMAETMPKSKAKSYEQLSKNLDAIEFIKRNLCYVAFNPADSEITSSEARFQQGDIDLPLGNSAWQAPEVLFDPALVDVGDKGLTNLVAEVLHRVDVSMKPELAQNILLTGGGSIFPGLGERLHTELRKQFPNLPMKIHVLDNPFERVWSSAVNLARMRIH
jgi:actin beta/gamma 1